MSRRIQIIQDHQCRQTKVKIQSNQSYLFATHRRRKVKLAKVTLPNAALIALAQPSCVTGERVPPVALVNSAILTGDTRIPYKSCVLLLLKFAITITSKDQNAGGCSRPFALLAQTALGTETALLPRNKKKTRGRLCLAGLFGGEWRSPLLRDKSAAVQSTHPTLGFTLTLCI